MLGLNVDNVVINLFYWFEKSTNRKAGLVEYCTFCDVDYRQIVKHVSSLITRPSHVFQHTSMKNREDLVDLVM